MKELTKKLSNVLSKINEISSSVGNDALYGNCHVSRLNNKEYLSGMMWLIGRSYAASPQRRSYGSSPRLEYKDVEKKTKRPIWRVRTENSGNGDFFLTLAESIIGYNGSADYKELCDRIEELAKSDEYNLTLSDEEKLNDGDVNRLIISIKCVSILNRLIKRGTEAFDSVPEGNSRIIRPDLCNENFKDGSEEERTEYIYCKNQVSFSSKLLHFFCPDSVFIIDQFSNEGGKTLFSKELNNSYEYILSNGLIDKDEKSEESDVIRITLSKDDFEKIRDKYNDLRTELENRLKKALYGEIIKDRDEITNLKKSKCTKLPQYLENSSPKNDDKKKNFYYTYSFVHDYIIHCVNSYVMCLCLKNIFGIEPKKTFPRLSDTLFMRLKAEERTIGSSTDESGENIYYKI